jgi:hypothetical protein
MKELEKLRRVDSLNIENVRRVFDVAHDIYSQLNLAATAKVTIAATPQNAKFRELLPYTTPQQLDAYEAGRQQGLAFLKEVGAITDFRVINPEAQRVKRQIEITVPSDTQLFNDLVDRLRSRLTPQTAKQPAATAPSELSYNANTNLLCYGDDTLIITSGSLEHFICTLVFENRGKKVNSLDIIEAWAGDEKKQSLYDACRRLNKKVEGAFSIKNLFICRQEKVWLNGF